MQKFRSMRLMLLALLLSLIPASCFAGVFISVGFAPPVLPVYEQPVCPEPGLMWTPGYWGYGPDGYYWVPGAWVPAPSVGVLWTPGYWGFATGAYVWYPGYWGPHVGYYGGVNYGFGYMGIGFAGGEWRGGVFAYNTAVMHVGVGGPWVGNRVYVDRTIVEHNTIINNNHVAFSGGPGGINHPPSAQESAAMHEQHIAATSAQTQHESVAMQDRSQYAKNNGGHPANVAVARPMTPRASANNAVRANGGVNTGAPARTYNASHSNTAAVPSRAMQAPAPRPAPAARQAPEARPAPAARPAPQSRPAPRPESHEKER